MFVFWKICRTLFSWNTRFEILLFALLPMNWLNLGNWKSLLTHDSFPWIWGYSSENTSSYILKSCEQLFILSFSSHCSMHIVRPLQFIWCSTGPTDPDFSKINKKVSMLLIPFQQNLLSYIFFLSGFSITDNNDSQDSRGREGTIFIPHYHFHPLTAMQAFIGNFACEVSTTYF